MTGFGRSSMFGIILADHEASARRSSRFEEFLEGGTEQTFAVAHACEEERERREHPAPGIPRDVAAPEADHHGWPDSCSIAFIR